MDSTGPPFDSEVFEIPHRPRRIPHETWQVTDEDGEPVTDERGEPVMAGGGFTIEGYTMFNLTSAEYDRDALDAVVSIAEDWGPYIRAEWEPYDHNIYDTNERCPFEVRVLPERLAIDVKCSTTPECVQNFVEGLVTQVDIEGPWTITKQSKRISA